MPHAANLERIRHVLRPSQWEGLGKRKRGAHDEGGKARRWTRAQLESVVQGSEAELEVGLRERNVVEVDGMCPLPFGHGSTRIGADRCRSSGRMLLLPTRELAPLLSLLLALLTIHTTAADPSKAIAREQPIVDALHDNHDVPPELTKAVMGIFGELEGDRWRVAVVRMVGEVGKGLLAGLPSEGKAVNIFMAEWKEQVGEMWDELVDLKLLEVPRLLGRTR